MHYYDTGVHPHLLAVDIVTGEVWADHDLEGSSFLELECTNRAFAEARYGLPQGAAPVEAEVGLVWQEGQLRHVGSAPVQWTLLDRQGRQAGSGRLMPGDIAPIAGVDGILLWQEGSVRGAVQVQGAH